MSDMNIQISKDLVEPIIRDKIAAAVVSELGDTTEFIKKMVEMTINQKVNENGEVGRYSSDNKYTLIDALSKKAMKELADEVLREFVHQQKPKLKAEMEKQLKRQTSKMAKIFLDGLTEAVEASWRMRCEVHFNSKEV